MPHVSIENFKAACKRMGNELKNSGVTLNHQAILDIVARSFGYKDYNTYHGCQSKVTLPDEQKSLKKTSITFRFTGGNRMVEKISRSWEIASKKGKVGESLNKDAPYIAPKYQVHAGKDYVIIEYHGNVSNTLTAFFNMDVIMASIDKDMLSHISSIVKTVESVYHEDFLEIINVMRGEHRKVVSPTGKGKRIAEDVILKQ